MQMVEVRLHNARTLATLRRLPAIKPFTHGPAPDRQQGVIDWHAQDQHRNGQGKYERTLSKGLKGNYSQSEADKHASCIAQKNTGRMKIITEECQTCSNKSQ